MFRLLYDPLAEIRKLRMQSFATVLLYLVAAALFETVGLLFFAVKIQTSFDFSAEALMLGVLGSFLFLVLVHLAVAFFFAVAMHVLDGKGGYYEALTALVLSFVAPAVGIFFGGALTFIPYCWIVSVVLIALGFVLGFATLFRASKELFQLDYSGVLIGFLITVIPLSLAVSVIVSLV